MITSRVRPWLEPCIEVDFEKIGGHLANAQSSYGKALRRFERLQDKLTSMEHIQKPQIASATLEEADSDNTKND